METQSKEKNETISSGELKRKLFIRDDRTIEIYIHKGALPRPVKEANGEEMLFDKKEILNILGAKSFEEEFIDSVEAAKVLEINRYYVHILARNGKIPHYRLKNFKRSQLFYLRSELEAAKKFVIRWDVSFADRLGKEKFMKDIFFKLLSADVTQLGERDRGVLSGIFVEDKTLAELAEKYHLTKGTIRHIFHRAIRRIRARISYLHERLNGVLEMQEELKIVKNKLMHYEEKENQLSSLSAEARVILFKNIEDFDFSVRLINICKYNNIHTLADLVKLSRWEFGRLRNAGERCITEVNEFLLSKGLMWKMKI